MLRNLLLWMTVPLLFSGAAAFGVILDGQITGADGYIHITENPYAQPITGGQTGSSDATDESAAYHRWDGSADVLIGDMDNGQGRAAIWNMFVVWDAVNLYIGIEGGSLTFGSWAGPGASPNDDNDQGDLYIAIDSSLDIPSGSEFLAANDGHSSFHDGGLPQAVDFQGWSPNYFVGVEWVDNTDFNDGFANVEQAGTHAVSSGEAPNQNDGGFEWRAGYTTFATYEFQIPWVDLGVSGGPAPGNQLSLSMYTTANFDQHDTYDSGPGVGQVTTYEEIGDFPGDRDAGGTDDGLFAGAPCVFGVPLGSFPGSNFVDPNDGNDYSGAPSRGDGIDTIQEYLLIAIAIPEPSSLSLLLLAAFFGFSIRKSRRRRR